MEVIMTNMNTTIYLVRHGQTEWNVQHRLQGHQDSPLTELGIKQAEWLGEALQEHNVDVIYSSSSPRAYRTADCIRRHREMNIIECDDFKEINLGEWEGQTQSSVKEKFPEQFSNFWSNPADFLVKDSETYGEVRLRALNKLNQIIEEHRGKSILIVTHTVVVKLLMAHFENRALPELWNLPYIHPACLCKIEIVNGQAEIVLHGDISHYMEEINGVES
jgi:broad specificity phosphatase PhoE